MQAAQSSINGKEGNNGPTTPTTHTVTRTQACKHEEKGDKFTVTQLHVCVNQLYSP